MARRRKPKSPEQIAAERLEREGRRVENARLRATGVEVVEDNQHRIIRAYRPDVFTQLHRRGAMGQGSFDAVAELERDLHLAMGWETERTMDHIPGSHEGAPGQNYTKAQLDAAVRVEVCRHNMSPRDFNLLNALLQPQAAILTRWRAVVAQHTGETRQECQASAVRAAAANLVWVRQNMDRLLRERAQARRSAA